MCLPFPVYVAAAGAFATAAIGWRRRLPLCTAALVLLAVAGLLLESSYQQALALVAVVLLGDGAAVGLAVTSGHDAPRRGPSGPD